MIPLIIVIVLALVLLSTMWLVLDLLDNKCGSKGILPESYTTRLGKVHTAKKIRSDHIN